MLGAKVKSLTEVKSGLCTQNLELSTPGVEVEQSSSCSGFRPCLLTTSARLPERRLLAQ